MPHDFWMLLLQQPWFWVAVMTIIFALALSSAAARDENDEKLKELEKAREAKLKRRLGDEEQRLTDFYNEPDDEKRRPGRPRMYRKEVK